MRRAAAAFGFGLGLLVIPPEWLVVGGGRVVDQAPSLQEIEDPADGADVADQRLPGVRKGELPQGVLPELLDDRVPVVHVNPRVLGGRGVEELREEPDLAFVDFVP